MSRPPIQNLETYINTRTTLDNNGCWLWSKSVTNTGYGRAMVRFGTRLAHRISYIIFKGAISEGLQIDHLCSNRLCVNPDHLEAVSPNENRLRSPTISTINMFKGKCAGGHSLDYVYKGKRACRICRNVASNKYKKERVVV